MREGSARAAIELETLTDGGQRPADVARGIAAFLADAQRSLDIAMYDIRSETDAGALVIASLLAAAQRGVAVRLVYDVAHPGPIPASPSVSRAVAPPTAPIRTGQTIPGHSLAGQRPRGGPGSRGG